MKLTAWVDRRASRDLYDLMAMVERGMITRDAFMTYGKYGQTTNPLAVRYFKNPPAEDRWVADLGHQCRLAVTAKDAITRVGQALAEIDALDGEYPGDDTPAWLSAPAPRQVRPDTSPTWRTGAPTSSLTRAGVRHIGVSTGSAGRDHDAVRVGLLVTARSRGPGRVLQGRRPHAPGGRARSAAGRLG